MSMPIPPRCLEKQTYKRHVLSVDLPAEYSLEDVFNPSNWAFLTTRLAKGDIIDIWREDGAFDMLVRVVDVGPTYAKMRPLCIFEAKDAPNLEAFDVGEVEVEYGGKEARWRVLHNKTIVRTGIETKAAAELAAREYRDGIKAAA